MKHLFKLSLLLLALMLPATASAYDFEVDGIYYNILGDNQVAVTNLGICEEDEEWLNFLPSYTGNVTIPEYVTYEGNTYSVTSIGDWAFEDCSDLTSVAIPNSVAEIGYAAFYGCCGLTSITIPNSVTSVVDCAFCGCSGLTSVTIPNSVTEIGCAAFQNCSGLTSVAIGNSVTTIDYGAFLGCSGLTSVTIPNSVTTIYYGAFLGCSGLTRIQVESGNTTFDSRDNCNAIIETASNKLIAGCKATDIPNSITSIGEDAFSGCSGLTSITIPNSVTSIGDYAFSGCSGLTSVNISDIEAWCKISFSGSTSNPLSYGHHLYLNGEEVTDLVIPNSVTSIGDWAFTSCSGLTSVTIPNSVTNIGDYTFRECSGLTSIHVESGNTTFDSRNNCNAIIETATNTLITGCMNTTIPNSVTNIGSYAFFKCTGLTNITIPNTVTSIGNYAFYVCSSLTSVTIPNSVKMIGSGAFRNCSGLTSVNISDIKAWCKISFYNSDSNPLSYAPNLYLNGEKVTELIIPNSVTSIGGYAFYGCSGLTSVTIPNSVTSIGNSAFQNCSGLNDVYSFIDDPTTAFMGGSVFYRYPSNYIERILHVPAGTVSAYQTNTDWSRYFGSIVEMGPMVATSLELDRSTAMMKPGDKLQLKAELQPIEAINNEVLWGSSNHAVATVSNNGLVTAVNVGTATITAMTTDGSNLSASCVVKVYTEMNGDVDGSGLVNISDVTALIDFLLNGDVSAIVPSNADSDGNGTVNISDVTTLIDYLLSGHWQE